MTDIWYLIIGLFVALSFFIISTMSMPKSENIVSKKYDINGTIYSCKKGFNFNKEKLICEVNKK